MITSVPVEVNLAGVYLPPLLIAAIAGVLATVVTAHFLNRYRLSRFFWYPPLVFLALSVIYTGFISIFIIKA